MDRLASWTDMTLAMSAMLQVSRVKVLLLTAVLLGFKEWCMFVYVCDCVCVCL